MVTAVNAQAALEVAWLEAYYNEQYWGAIETELAVATEGSMAKDFNARSTTLGDAANAGSVNTATT